MPPTNDNRLAESLREVIAAANDTVKKEALKRVEADQEEYVNPFEDSPGLDILDEQLEEGNKLLETALSEEEATEMSLRLDEAAENKNDSAEWTAFAADLLVIARKVFLTV